MPVDTPLYHDATRPAETRAQDLLARMTLEEKVRQMSQHDAGLLDRPEALRTALSQGIGTLQDPRIGPRENAERVNAIDHAYIITELAPRGSLADALKSHPQRNNWATLARWALDIANGLQYLHTLSPPVLHLDLKPQNLLLFDDCAKLCDFGIAHIAEHTLTHQTVEQFSFRYAAPEQFAKAPISAATDIYGLGGVLFAMIDPTRWQAREGHQQLEPKSLG